MRKNDPQPAMNTPPELCRGRVEMATYRDPIVEFYRKNPLIEALPPILSD
jgi:hypothetical protein